MKNVLQIERLPYEEPYHINLIVKASSNGHSGQLEIYDDANFLKELAGSLEQFPKNPTDEIKWELGSEKPEDRYAFYFLFKVLNQVTHGWTSAIHIRFNNNEIVPFRTISEFCIPCEPAGLNRLGKLFREFAKLKSRKLIWDGVDGEIVE
ncbi:hypothetical protein [Flagellimonas flava]|uniref:hypothetical protein n=1 Tax=Flagellimonas flava TaxID=570519 RepID=UPI003D65BDF5